MVKRPFKNLGVKWAESIGSDECPMMVRWVILTPIGSIRLHHFLRPDHDRDAHDHPWWFITVMLKGSYLDRSVDTETGEHTLDHLRRGSIRFRPAHHRHWVETDNSWTLILTGRVKRTWGFWNGIKFLFHYDYRGKNPHAPCE